MWFLQTVKASVYDPAFYRSILEKKGSSAFGYFALIAFIFALITSFAPVREVAMFVFQPSAEKDAFRQQVLALYPDALQFKIGNGKLSMNVESPYIIPMPKDMRNEKADGADTLPKNLLAINTEKPIDTSDFRAYDTLVVLGADSIGILDQEKGKIQIQSLEKIFDTPYALDKAQFVSLVGTLERVLKGFGIALLFLIPLFMFLGLVMWYPLYLVFGALAVWLAAKLRGADWGYGTSYKAGLYLITVPLAYNQLVSSAIFPEIPVPFFFTIVLFTLAFLNIKKADPQPQETVAASIASLPTVETEALSRDSEEGSGAKV